MSRLNETPARFPPASRRLPSGRVLATGPTGRARLLSARGTPPAEHADITALAEDWIRAGRFNWAGPKTHVLVTAAKGPPMTPETAKAVVDFIFDTPTPRLTMEIVDAPDGWPAAWMALSYARRMAEWNGRELALWLRTNAEPAADRREFLDGYEVGVRGALTADGPPPARLWSASRWRVSVSPNAATPDAWVDRLRAAGARGVEWVATPEVERDMSAARRFAAFASRALECLIETGDGDIRDELTAALLCARPWDIPGMDLLETLAYAPDGGIFSSEEAISLDLASYENPLRLGRVSELRYADFPELSAVSALCAATMPQSQPFCTACAYAPYCAVPPSAHLRSQGSLFGRPPDSPRCLAHMALLDTIFSRLPSEKYMKILEKWGVDITRFAC